jgi:ATP-dependent protease HslVU (ClpYQ) peptidase subunit
MTCVVAITDGTNTLLAADSSASEPSIITNRLDPKVFKIGEFGIGFSSSFRLGQILKYHFCPPNISKKQKTLMEYMVTQFVPELRLTLEEQDFPYHEEEKVSWTIVVCVRNEIFYIEPDWHVGQDSDFYVAIGSGAAYARGSLFTTQYNSDLYDRVSIALKASANYSPFVAEPFYIIEV